MSVSVNGFTDRVIVETRAASSTTGDRLKFFIPDGHPMNASLRPVEVDRAMIPEEGVLTEVETVKLDDALPERVDFLKIDAEGAERQIWHGLTRTLRANDNIQVFLEFRPIRYGSESDDFLDEIEEVGFKLAFVDYDGRIKHTTRSDIISHGTTDVMLCLSK